MAIVELTHGQVTMIDDADVPLVEGQSWCARWAEGKSGVHWYAVGSVDGKQTYLHRFLLGLKPGDPHIDHWNRDGLDNRRKNLRLATRTQNMANSIGHPTRRASPYKGVSWQKDSRRSAGGRWRAQMKSNGKNIRGYARTEIEAAEAYNRLAAAHFGEFARRNGE